jgi:hypothetical protein
LVVEEEVDDLVGVVVVVAERENYLKVIFY